MALPGGLRGSQGAYEVESHTKPHAEHVVVRAQDLGTHAVP